MWSTPVLPVFVWVLSRYSSFPPEYKVMLEFRLTDDFKLIIGMNVSVNGCLPLFVSQLVCDRGATCVGMYLAFCPMTAGIGSSPLQPGIREVKENGFVL